MSRDGQADRAQIVESAETVESVDAGDSVKRVDEARRDAAVALRDLVHAFAAHDATAQQLDELTATLYGLTENLETTPARSRATHALSGTFAQVDGVVADELPEGPIADTFSDRPISGSASPYGLDLDVRREGDEIVARFTLRHGHEGATGRSHGGFVAAVFDDVFGFVLGILRQPAFTGELTVRYLRPTPLHRPLECRVRLDRQEGRKLLMSGELADISSSAENVDGAENADGAEIVATATTTFITVDPAIFQPPIAQSPIAQPSGPSGDATDD